MYIPHHYEQTETEPLYRLIIDHPLGALVTNGPNGLDANHIPFHLHSDKGDNGILSAHVARANPVWQEVKDNEEVLVIFSKADAYISPNWYPSKHEFHKQVPTWNYQVVHVHGKITVRDDEKFVRGVVAHLTREHEQRAGGEKVWKMSDAPREYISQMLAAIVGIEIEITRIVGKWKLSQNREERDIVNAANELRQRGEQTIAKAMLAAK